ncbi:MAG: PAS domain S-box protein [Proteobacteria bacterium]|nr:PAS domain S-box protein [Pseudomonadota bacterium]MBU4472353.1 PAS domain S-box protein [Pseudomonadota bacterium]MCG2752049.1 PAS domain S-box protein [Desulfobacteraceae bacterium]
MTDFENMGIPAADHREEELRNWRTTFDATNDAIWILDKDQHILQANKTAKRMFQESFPDLIGRYCWEIVHHTARPIPECPLKRAKISLHRESMELKVGERWFLVTIDPILDAAGHYDGAVHIISDITGRKKAEVELRESEDRYRDLVENSRDLICTHDLKGRILSVNPWATKVLGVDRDTLLQMNLRDFLMPETTREFDEYLKTVETQGEVKGLLAIQTRTGKKLIWEYHTTLRSKESEEPIVRGVAHDITERKQVMDALRESEEKYRTLVESLPQEVFAKDRQSVYLSCNENFARDLEIRPEEIVGKTDYDFFPEELAEKYRADDFRIMASGRTESFEDQYVKNGRNAWAYTIKTPIRDKDGNTVGVLGVFSDITEQKQASMERERMMAAIEQVGDIIFTTDGSGAIQYVNPAFERVTGYVEEEVLGKNPRFLKSGKQDRAFYEDLWTTISSGETWQGRMLNKRKNGTLYTDETTISPVRDSGGKIISFVAVKRDITEQLRLEAQFQQAQKMESVGRLAGGVAHDFNNMLSVINGYAELAMDRVPPDDPVHDALEEILNAARRSTEVVRQLLAFARKQTIAPRVLDLNETVEGMLRMLRRLIGEDIDLVWLSGAKVWPVRMDPSQIDQILANLCINARDAITGVGNITIETGQVSLDEEYCSEHSGASPGDYVVLTVRDNGHGMEKEILDNLFEPFFTTKEVGEGTGLGLATVYGIVKQNHGFIHVSSEPGKGTLVKIHLPCYQGETGMIPAKIPSAIRQGKGETVLVVEDEAAILKMTAIMLEKLGYTVMTANAPGEALILAEAFSGAIDLLITDVIMPDMNGPDLAGQLTALFPKIKVLFISGYTADAIAHHGVMDPGVHLIQKPFSTQELAAKIQEVIGLGTEKRIGV